MSTDGNRGPLGLFVPPDGMFSLAEKELEKLRAALKKKEEASALMIAAACGILAVGRAIERKAPGDEELKGALDHLEETIGELVP